MRVSHFLGEMAYQNKTVAFAGKLMFAKNSDGALCAFFVPPQAPEPDCLDDFRVMDVQVLKGHLKERSRGDLFRLCTEHGVACSSGTSKSDLMRALCDACISPVGLNVQSKAFGAMTSAEMEEGRRIVEAKLQQRKKSSTAFETKQLTKFAQKLFREVKNDPELWQTFQSMTFDKEDDAKNKFIFDAIKKTMVDGLSDASGVSSGVSSGNEESVTYDEADEPVVDDAPSPSGMSTNALRRFRIEQAFPNTPLERIEVCDYTSGNIILTGEYPVRRMIALDLLKELHDLQRLEPFSLRLCNMMTNQTLDALTRLGDYMDQSGGNRFYVIPNGLLGGGKATVMRSIQKEKPDKKAFLKTKTDELYKSMCEMKAGCELLKDVKGITDHIQNVINTNNGQECQQLFAEGIKHLGYDDVQECLRMFAPEDQTERPFGGTESKVELMSKLLFRKWFDRLEEHKAEIENTKACLIVQMTHAYNIWCFKNRYDNSSLVSILKGRKDEIAKAQQTTSQDVEMLSKAFSATKL